jgi:hypothetical protein
MGKWTKQKGKVKRGGLSFRFFRSTPKRKIDPQQLKIEHALDTIEANQRYVNDKHKKAIEEIVDDSKPDDWLDLLNEHKHKDAKSIPEVEFTWPRPKKSYNVVPNTVTILQNEWFFPEHEAVIKQLFSDHKGPRLNQQHQFESLTSLVAKNEKHLNLFPLQGYMWILTSNLYVKRDVKMKELVQSVHHTLESKSYYPRFKELFHAFNEKTSDKEPQEVYLQKLMDRCELAIHIFEYKNGPSVDVKFYFKLYFTKLQKETAQLLQGGKPVDESIVAGLLFKFYIGVIYWLGDSDHLTVDHLLDKLLVYLD